MKRDEQRGRGELLNDFLALLRQDRAASIAEVVEQVNENLDHSLRIMDRLLDISLLKEEKLEKRNNLSVLKGECSQVRKSLSAMLQSLGEGKDDHTSSRAGKSQPLVDPSKVFAEEWEDLRQLLPFDDFIVEEDSFTSSVEVAAPLQEIRSIFKALLIFAYDKMEGRGKLRLSSRSREESFCLTATLLPLEQGSSQLEPLNEAPLCLSLLKSLSGDFGFLFSTGVDEGGHELCSFRFSKESSNVHPSPSLEASFLALDGSERAPLRVLLIDDERDIREFFQALLKMRIHSVETAENTEQAREILAREEIDLVFLDSRMPRNDGLDFFKNYLSKEYPRLPVVLFTGSENPKDPAIAEAGFYGILVKPCRGWEIFAVLETFLREGK